MNSNLYREKTIKEKYSKIKITEFQKKIAKEWIKKLKNKELERERENYFVFRDDILRDLLGYPEKKILYEKKFVEFSIQDNHGDTSVCFEAKGAKTKKLHDFQGRKKDQATPVIQTRTNMERFPSTYGVCTNYRNFILLDINKKSKYYEFDFLDIEKDEDRLKEFVSMFSYDNLVVDKSLEQLYKDSISEERKFGKEFYKLYHETRLMLIKAFQEKENVSMSDAIHFSQLYLNRLIFTFFKQDKKHLPAKLFTKNILDILEKGNCTENTKFISDYIKKLFKYLDVGNMHQNIFGFGGELFKEKIPLTVYIYDVKDPDFFKDVKQYSELSKNIELDELSLKIIKKYNGKINPIISNLLIMDSFDFTSEVDVKILGQIFEQSISDLEELKQVGISKRKDDGVFYTPEYITEYICYNTIIPYLSKNKVTTIEELIIEHIDDIEELEKKVRKIKILDPACGSGAFLVKAAETLLKIAEQIQNLKPIIEEQKIIDNWTKEDELKQIIGENIFGVDVNEESVEITKLSLFLQMSAPNKKLSDISKNIIHGNSIVKDNKIIDNAFNWEKSFNEIFKNGGFDIVIGNPPYVRHELITEIKPHLQAHYSTYHGMADLYVYFIEKGISVLKKNGLFSIIVSNKFTKRNYGKNLRKYLLNYNLNVFLDFGDLPVFEDAKTYPCIINLEKVAPSKYVNACKINSLKFDDLADFVNDKLEQIDTETLQNSSWSFSDAKTHRIFEKMAQNSIPFGELVDNKFYRGVTTGLNSAFVIDNKTKDEIISKDPKSEEIIFPYLSGNEIKRYGIEWKQNYLIFTRRGTEISKYPEIKNHLEKFRKQLEPKKNSKEKEGRKQGNYKWYEIQDTTDYWKIFLKEGIIFPHFNKKPNFTFSKGRFFPNAKGYQVESKDYWLIAILNSELIHFYLKSICPFVQGEYYEYNSEYIEKIPISRKIKYKKHLSDLSKKILENQEKRIQIKNKIHSRILFTFKLNKIPKNLEEIHKLDFNQFLEFIYKKSSVQLTDPKIGDEWQEYFEGHKKTIIELINRNRVFEEEINSIVYQMYEITEQEKNMIET
jgi:hypothetical protein